MASNPPQCTWARLSPPPRGAAPREEKVVRLGEEEEERVVLVVEEEQVVEEEELLEEEEEVRLWSVRVLSLRCWRKRFLSSSGVWPFCALTMQVGRWRFSMYTSCCFCCFSSSIWALRSALTPSSFSDSWGREGGTGSRNREEGGRRRRW